MRSKTTPLRKRSWLITACMITILTLQVYCAPSDDLSYLQHIPQIPQSCYRGPYDGFVSMESVIQRVKRIGSKTEAKDDYQIYQFKLGRATYLMQESTSGYISISLDKNVGTKDFPAYAPLFVIAATALKYNGWWNMFTTKDGDRVCSFHFADKYSTAVYERRVYSPPVPEGAIMYEWFCDVGKMYSDTKRTLERIEFVDKNGNVLKVDGMNGMHLVPIERSQSWSCEPKNIPAEVRFESEIIRFLLKKE